MTPERWDRIKQIFGEAADLDPRERSAWLQKETSGDPALLSEVEALLRSHDSSGAYLDRELQPAFSVSAVLDGHAFRSGEVVNGRFRIIRFLGQGGMGEVYEADDLTLKTSVAIKTVRYDVAGNEEIRERFRREILLARRVTHPNVCRLFDVGVREDPPVLFLTMELLEGETLSMRLKNSGIYTTVKAMPIASQLASALDAAHAAGVVHRDFKAGNVMLVRAADGSERAVVTDFGLARGLASDSDNSSSYMETGGRAIGTPAYMAPEQIEGKPAGPEADIYALGVVLYEMVTGHRPYAESSPLALAAKKVSEPPRALTSFVPDIDAKWQAAVLRCLAIKPADRFRDAHSVIAALDSQWSAVAHRLRPRAGRRAAIAAAVLAAAAIFGAWFWNRPRNTALEGETARWYTQAREAMHAGASWRASKLLERVTSAAPRYPLAHARLAEAYAELDMLDRAKDEMLRTTEAAPDRSRLAPNDALAIDAAQATVLRDFARAAGTYQKIADSEAPSSKAGALLDLGRAFERANQPPKAIETFDKALAVDSQNAAAKLRLAILYGRKPDLAKAGPLFAGAEANYRVAGDFEGVAETLLQKSRTYRNGQKLADSKSSAAGALDLAKTTGNTTQQIRARYELAMITLLEGRDVDAARETDSVVELARREGLDNLAAQGLNDLGAAYLTQYKLKEAESTLRLALDLAKRTRSAQNEMRASFLLGSTLSRSGDVNQALTFITPVVQFYRNGGYRETTAALTLLTDARISLGQYPLASASATELRQMLEATGDPFQLAVARERDADIQTWLGAYPKAIEIYASVEPVYQKLGRKHQELYARANRADLAQRLGRSAEAQALLASADKDLAALGDGGHPIAVRIAWIRAYGALARGDHAAAQRYANQVLKEPPGGSAFRALDAQLALGLAKATGPGPKAEGRRLCEEALARVRTMSNIGYLVSAKVTTASAILASGDRPAAAALAQEALKDSQQYGMEEIGYRAALIAGDQTAISKSASALQQHWGAETFNQYQSRADIQVLRRGK